MSCLLASSHPRTSEMNAGSSFLVFYLKMEKTAQ